MAQVQEKKTLSQESASVSSRQEMRAALEKNKRAGEQAVKNFWDAYSLSAHQSSDD